MRTSKPAASAASKRRPFFIPARLEKRAVWQPCLARWSGNRSRKRRSTHSSTRIRIRARASNSCSASSSASNIRRGEPLGIPPGNAPAFRPLEGNRTRSGPAPASLGIQGHACMVSGSLVIACATSSLSLKRVHRGANTNATGAVRSAADSAPALVRQDQVPGQQNHP